MARQRRFEVLADLAAQGRALLHQAAAIADQQLQAAPRFIQPGLDEGKAIGCSSTDRGQIGIVGLIARIRWLPELLGRVRMHQARIEASRAEGVLTG
ncbi:MAG TPA: hypothetical protein VKT78_18790 [Fimbriimonadaceae bacterium]|nr:hypothetical protein [Fimbriimonadaceae bacterium]